MTPHADACLPGITRKTVMTLARGLNVPTTERRVSLAEFHSADEVFLNTQTVDLLDHSRQSNL